MILKPRKKKILNKLKLLQIQRIKQVKLQIMMLRLQLIYQEVLQVVHLVVEEDAFADVGEALREV